MHYTECWYQGICPKSPEGCKEICPKFVSMRYFMKSSNLPKSKWFPILLVDKDDSVQYKRLSNIKSNIEEWVATGQNLYLYSPRCGNGKTSWAIKLMHKYFDQTWNVGELKPKGIFVSVPEFLDRGREVISNRDDEFVKIKNDILNTDLVIWDDISSVKLTDYAHSVLFNYIDARCLSGKSNIFTGNMDEDQLLHFLGERLSSRIWNGSEVIQFNNPDMRGVKRNG